MTTPEQPLIPSRKHLWRYLPILLVLGLATYFLLPQLATLKQSWSVVQNMLWWAVALAALAQVFSYLGSGFILYSILKINHEKLPIWKGALIAMATLSISMIAGGGIGLAASYRWIHRESLDEDTAALAGTLPALLNTVILIGVSLIGVLYLILVHDLTSTQLIEFGTVLLVLGLATAGIFIALRFSGMVNRVALWFMGHWAAIRHKSFLPESTNVWVKNFYIAINSLGNSKWLFPLLGAAINTGFDMMTLYFMFIAAGHKVTLGTLSAGYGLPLVLGKLAFIFPGGVGVIEGSMVALYDSLKVPNAISVVVILGYRLFSFWLPILFGFIAVAYLSGKLSASKKKKA